MTYIMDRYGQKAEHQERIQMLWEKTKELERKIFRRLPFSPDDLDHHLATMDIPGELLSYRKACSQLTSGSS
jgi:hypothetical protein